MNIAVVLGDASTSICSKVGRLRDDLNIVPFLSLGELFRESEYLQYSIDRVLLTAKVLRQGDIEDNISRLSELLRSQKDFSSVVFLCKEDSDNELEELLLTKFAESECAVLSVLSTSVTSMLEFMSASIKTLQDEYGYESKLGTGQVSVIEDEVALPEELTPTPAPVVEQPKPKKGFFLNTILGKGKETEPKPEIKDETDEEEETDEVEPEEEDSQDSDDLEDEPIEDLEIDVESEEETREVTDFDDDDEEELSKELPVNPSSLGVEEPKPENISTFDESQFKKVDIKETLADVTNSDNLVEVDESGDLLDLSSEEQYRQPKVQIVEKEVEKIVERVVTVNGGKVSVFAKQSSRMILVTGDRRSGVTSTAWGIAKEFSKNKLSVLYVDCDSKRHGVLSYIDYTEFCKNDTLTKGAMHLSTSWDNLRGGQFRESANLNIVSANYDVEVTEEDLKRVLELVSMYYTDYDVVVLDVPMENLACAESVIPLSKCVVTCESTVNALFSYILSMDCNELLPKFQNLIAKKGTMLFTKSAQSFNVAQLRVPVSNVLSPDYDWFGMKSAVLQVLDEGLLSYILEV